MINKKISDYFSPKTMEKNAIPLLPAILALILFLTIVPVGSFLNIFWVLLARLIFWILVKTKLIIIKEVPGLVEVIE